MKNLKILIVEDEEALKATLQLKLKKEGFKVEAVEDGAKALEAVQEFKPDLVLLDLVLPHMSGQEILVKIKKDKELKDIPVITISNSGQPIEIKELLKLGADDYIIKADFTIDDILERVNNVLQKQEGKIDVLIVEDEAFLRFVLLKKLRLAGLKTVTALDGENAVRTVLQFQPKVLILDLLMPGLGGLDVLRKLKRSRKFDPKKTKIIILSNYSAKEKEPLIREMTKGYFIKANLDIDDVVQEVRKLLG